MDRFRKLNISECVKKVSMLDFSDGDNTTTDIITTRYSKLWRDKQTAVNIKEFISS
jgi:hypothetical protein